MRRFSALTAALVFMLMLAIAPSATATSKTTAPKTDPYVAALAPRIWAQFGDHTYPAPPPPGPADRVTGYAPQPAGTEDNAYLDFGPYLIGPGQDLSRLDFQPAQDNGFTLETRMFVMDAITGEVVNGHEVHTHHAHLIAIDPTNPSYYRWIYGTGEEMTGGSLDARAQADPRYKQGLRYGMFTQKGERLGVLSMLHNKTSEPRLVYLRVWIRYVHGTHDEIKAANGQDFHTLIPQIFGGTFNVPRTNGRYAWPIDLTSKIVQHDPHAEGGTTASPTGPAHIKPGLGVTLESAWSGRLVVAGGHLHAGGTQAFLSNMGTKARPCPNRDGDRFPGTTIARSAVIGRDGVWPTEDFQMGLTQNDWRAYIRKGDTLVGNGEYLASPYAYPDAMLFFGIYVDVSEPPPAKAGCDAQLLHKPHANRTEVTRTIPNHPWNMYPEQHMCHEGHCETPAELPKPGPATNVVHIANFAYLPGQLGGPTGPPVVTRGQGLTFINEDYAALGLVRHTVSTCKFPCNGMVAANYPFPDGVVESGPLGYMVEDAYVSYQTTPQWTLDTASLTPGYYAYYCRLHAFMRGGFYIE